MNGAAERPKKLRVDFLLGEHGPLIDAPGRVALSSCPGRTDVGGSVESDVQHLSDLGIGVVLSLVSDPEMEFYGVSGLRRELRKHKVHSLQFPIEDTQPPRDLAKTQALCKSLLGWLGEGKSVLIHCIGGWGRSGTIAAALLTHQGYSPESAIALVRRSRNPRCVESLAQERFVAEYARAQTGFTRYYFFADRRAISDGELIGGELSARTLVKRGIAREKIFSQDALAAAVSALSAEARAELVILSGEVLRGSLTMFDAEAEWALDRALSHDGQRWRAVPIASLLG